jgi:hypothetical protein
MNTARVSVFARVFLNTVSDVSTLDDVECRTFDPSFQEKTICFLENTLIQVLSRDGTEEYVLEIIIMNGSRNP